MTTRKNKRYYGPGANKAASPSLTPEDRQLIAEYRRLCNLLTPDEAQLVGYYRRLSEVDRSGVLKAVGELLTPMGDRADGTRPKGSRGSRRRATTAAQPPAAASESGAKPAGKQGRKRRGAPLS